MSPVNNAKPHRPARPPNEVVVVGNVGVDTNVYLNTPAVDFSVEANFTENRDTIGQAGGYAALGYAHLGWQTGFIGQVGEDPFGDHIRSVFKQEKIDMRGLFPDPAGTSRSVNIITPDGRRKNFYDGKSHMTLNPDPAEFREILDGARLAHFNIPNWARRLLPLARELGLVIACDLQDITNPVDPYRLDFAAYADYLFFSSANHPDPRELIRAMMHLRPQQVIVVGMGVDGCALGSDGVVRFFPVEEMALPIVDTNGAGDSLAVGFLASRVLEGRSLEESIRRGQIAARWCCSLKNDKTALITRKQLDSFASE